MVPWMELNGERDAAIERRSESARLIDTGSDPDRTHCRCNAFLKLASAAIIATVLTLTHHDLATIAASSQSYRQ